MPRVVPSQVKKLMEELYPVIATGVLGGPVTSGMAGQLSAIVRLIDELPAELLPADPDDYSELTLATEEIRHNLRLWQSRGDVGTLRPAKGINPLMLIYRVLSKCRDEAPSAETASLAFIADAELRDSIRLDLSSAERDLGNANWKGATVLAAAAAEALLLWAIEDEEEKRPGVIGASRAKLIRAGKMSAKGSADPEDWVLANYIDMAHDLTLITDETATAARLAKDFRNLIHPGRAARLAQVCDIATAHSSFAAAVHVVRDLTKRG